MAEKPDEPYYIVIIIKRFSRSHDDDIGHPLFCIFLNLIDLLQYLRRPQISRQPIQGRGTETAAHAAACLRRNTDRVAVFILHKYALNDMAVRKPEQIFACAVDPRYFHVGDPERYHFIVLCQPAAELPGQIRHILKRIRQLLVKPLEDLFCTKSLEPLLLQAVSQFFRIQRLHICFFSHHILLNTARKKPSPG